MKILKDDSLFGGADVGVYLSSGEGAVAEDGLDVFYVYAFFQKEGGEGVAECVRGDGFVDAGSQGQFLIMILTDWEERLRPRWLMKKNVF